MRSGAGSSLGSSLNQMSPLAAAMVVALLLMPVTPGWQFTRLDLVAKVLTLCLLASMWLLGPRLPAWTQALTVCLLIPVIGLLRHAHGGSGSGYSPLALLPVLWLALHGSRRALLAGLTVLAATFTLPLLTLADTTRYPAGAWRLAALLVLTAAVVGVSTQRLTRQLADLVTDLRTVAHVARNLPSDDKARAAVCTASREISDADFVMLFEPDASRRSLLSTAADGTDTAVSLSLNDSCAVVVAFRSGTPYFSTDCASDPAVGPKMASTGAVSLLVYPVVRDGKVIGVLALGFGRRRRGLRSRVTETVGLLAAEAALAIERADMVDRLSVAARTDGLTQAANRRGWEAALDREDRFGARRPRVIALLDLDHFKRYNDTHGHQNGDALLQSCVRLWQSVLRPGDTLARWGGEEFALLLPDCTAEGANGVLDRLRTSMPAGSTVSIGAGAWLDGEDPATVLEEVDAALYAAKHGGRDRVVWRRTTLTLSGDKGGNRSQLAWPV